MVTLSAVSCGGQSVYCQVNNVEWVGVKQNDNLDNLEIGGTPSEEPIEYFRIGIIPLGQLGMTFTIVCSCEPHCPIFLHLIKLMLSISVSLTRIIIRAMASLIQMGLTQMTM